MGSFFSSPKDENIKTPENNNTKPIKYQKPAGGQTCVPIVICYAYIGTGYHGLQRNFGLDSIEDKLIEILIASNLLSSESVQFLSKLKWKEASRTDSGVHAAAQVLTLTVPFPKGLKLYDVLHLLETHTPSDSPITFWSVISVSHKFDAQSYAQYRQYNYLMPLSTIGDYPLDSLREKILPYFIGEKNFHNYTKKISATNKSAIRIITDFTVSDPFEVSPNGQKYVLFYIRGNSFMLNQIRKMLGTILALTHNLMTFEQLADTFTHNKWNLPRLIGDGLFLNKVEYSNFNEISKTRKDFGASRDVEFASMRPSIEYWKKNVLFPHIERLVNENDIFNQWVNDTLLIFPPELKSEADASA